MRHAEFHISNASINTEETKSEG